MHHPHAGFSLLLAVALVMPWRPAEAAAPSSEPAGTAPAATDAQLRARLGIAVKRELEAAGLAPTLGAFKVSPALIQLRRYVHAQSKQAEWLCVVDLALLDETQGVVASVRGSAVTSQSAAQHALDAAAHAAVTRLPQMLQALDDARKKAEKVARH